MKLCGLTGGVGMGKSTAADFLSRRGARVVDTDELARQLARPGQPALAEIEKAFGPGLLAPDGTLNREQLAGLVFAEAAARRELEAILHPRIRAAWQAQVAQWRRENVPLAVVVIPLLFETGAENLFEKILCAACTPAAQRERLRARGWPDKEIGRRNAAQLPVAEKLARAHLVLWTEGRLESLARQIDAVWSRI